ncbi:MAG TPA: T9SS type A sorting domain-containing protein [Bacteroidales bacterium]|nr:T9SS type A sorting domain-containing protein [Bacteroidales bacterium]
MKKAIFIFLLKGTFLIVRAQNCDTNLFPNGHAYYDTYHEFAGTPALWKHYNTHDPTVYKDGDWYYMYSTDASWGGVNKNGALKRRSKDLVNWEFLGGLNQKWRFIREDSIPIDTTDIIYPRLIPSAADEDFIYGQQEQFRVFPNPGNDGYVTVTLPPDQEIEYHISVYDMTGKIIKDILIPAGFSIYRLDTHDIDRGIYII